MAHSINASNKRTFLTIPGIPGRWLGELETRPFPYGRMLETASEIGRDPATSCKTVSQAKFYAILHWKYSAGTNEDIAGGANEAGNV